MADDVTAALVRELFRYDPMTGEFVRLVARSNVVKVGDVAGFKDRHGHIRIGIGSKEYSAHRIAWLYMTGEWPKGDVDHIDGMPSNNRWQNLRAVSHQVNQQNRRRPAKHNKTGVLGVGRSSDGKRYVARLVVNGRSRHLGTFDNTDDAYAAYVKAKRALHPGCTL